jgi:hypothetical protein
MGQGIKLTTHLHQMPRSRMMELLLTTGTTLLSRSENAKAMMVQWFWQQPRGDPLAGVSVECLSKHPRGHF